MKLNSQNFSPFFLILSSTNGLQSSFLARLPGSVSLPCLSKVARLQKTWKDYFNSSASLAVGNKKRGGLRGKGLRDCAIHPDLKRFQFLKEFDALMGKVISVDKSALLSNKERGESKASLKITSSSPHSGNSSRKSSGSKPSSLQTRKLSGGPRLRLAPDGKTGIG